MRHSLLLAIVIGGLSGCAFGQADCDTYVGAAALACQEYRQRKANADLTGEAAGIVKAYRLCLQKYEAEPAKAKENCAVYTQALHEIEVKGLNPK